MSRPLERPGALGLCPSMAVLVLISLTAGLLVLLLRLLEGGHEGAAGVCIGLAAAVWALDLYVHGNRR